MACSILVYRCLIYTFKFIAQLNCERFEGNNKWINNSFKLLRTFYIPLDGAVALNLGANITGCLSVKINDVPKAVTFFL